MVNNTNRANWKYDDEQWQKKYGGSSNSWSGQGSSWSSGTWKGDDSYGRAPTYKAARSQEPYVQSDRDWDMRSETSKRSNRSTVKTPRSHKASSGASSETSFAMVSSGGDGYGDGNRRRSRGANNAGGGSSNDHVHRDVDIDFSEAEDVGRGDGGADNLGPPRSDGSEGRSRHDHWNVRWDRTPQYPTAFQAADDGFIGKWYSEIKDALGGIDFDPNHGYIQTYAGGAGAAGAIRSCLAEAQAPSPKLDYVCSCCAKVTPRKGELAQMLASIPEIQQVATNCSSEMPPNWNGPPKSMEEIADRPELAACGWPRFLLPRVSWTKFAPEAISIDRAIEGRELPSFGSYKLGEWRHSYQSKRSRHDCLISVCLECYMKKEGPEREFTGNTWNTFCQQTRYSEKDLRKSIFGKMIRQMRKEAPGQTIPRSVKMDLNKLAKEIAEKCRGEDLVALAHASDWSPRVAENVFLLYTCVACRKACVNQGGWWLTYTGSGRRTFRCPFCGEPFAYGEGADLRLLALSFFGTPSSAFTCYLGSIPTPLDNDLRYLKMAMLYNKLGDRTLAHLAFAIEEMNLEAIAWFQRMGLGKVGVSCNVHQKIMDEGRGDFENVLMTDHRLMCDVAGKELLYVETSAEGTHVLGPEDLMLLLMLLWGHLCVESLELDGVEFQNPKDMGASSEHWGKAANRSCNHYTGEYTAAKEKKAGVFGSFKDRLNGLVARVSGTAAEEVRSIEV